MKTSERLAGLAGYAFAELDALRDRRLGEGADVIDFGVGDPTDPVPELVVQAARDGLERHRTTGYPSYVGSREFRVAVADWLERRHGVRPDPETQVTISQGSKEAIFHLPWALTDPGDVVLAPSPGYPPYARGARMVDARVEFYPVTADGPGLPDLDQLPAEVSESLALVWITQPHVPTGRSAGLAALTRLRDQVRDRGAVLCSDEAYSELWMDSPCDSALQTGLEDVLVFQSLSKRSGMTGYRVGFVAGDERGIAALRTIKTNIDSGTPRFIEDAAMAALADESEPAAARKRYARRAETMLAPLRALGCRVDMPDAGFYLWVRTPRSMTGVEFARRLLSEEPTLAVMPGEWLSDPATVLSDDGLPGDGHVRFALVPSLERCRQAAERLGAWSC